MPARGCQNDHGPVVPLDPSPPPRFSVEAEGGSCDCPRVLPLPLLPHCLVESEGEFSLLG